MPLTRIITGGQSGVDRGAMDAARALGLEVGGWVAPGWTPGDEDGCAWASAMRAVAPEEVARIPEALIGEIYPGSGEADTPSLRARLARTRANVRDSDGVLLLIAGGAPSGGTGAAMGFAIELAKAYHIVRLTDAPEQAGPRIAGWLETFGIGTLNVAGPTQDEGALRGGAGERGLSVDAYTCARRLLQACITPNSPPATL